MSDKHTPLKVKNLCGNLIPVEDSSGDIVAMVIVPEYWRPSSVIASEKMARAIGNSYNNHEALVDKLRDLLNAIDELFADPSGLPLHRIGEISKNFDLATAEAKQLLEQIGE